MKKKNSVDLFDGVSSNSNRASSLFINQLDNKKVLEEEKLSLTPIEFLCEHHGVVDYVAKHLTSKYPDIMNDKCRKKIEVDAYNDIVQILTDKNLLPKKELLPNYIKLIFADILGVGILEPLLEDKTIDEIIVQSHDLVIVERFGKLERSDYRFPSVENAKSHIDKIIAPLNKRLNPSSPNVNAQLPDGSRLSASIAPLRANGEISLTIRKFSEHVEPLIHYCEKYRSSTPEMVQFLEAAVKTKQSMIVSGGTGSGKTTLLNSLSMAIPNDERIITVEDTLELRLQQPFVEAYQTIEANMEGKGAFSMQQVIIETLRKRPDRIVVGECRGPEIVEMLNAMNTGHEGSLSTIHANNAKDMLSRALTMVLSNESTRNLKDSAIYQMLDSALSLIVQTNRLQDGSRKVTAICEVVGFGERGFEILKSKGILGASAKCEANKLYLQDIFRFETKSVDDNGSIHGQFVATGYTPECLIKIQESGINLDASIFNKRILMEV